MDRWIARRRQPLPPAESEWRRRELAEVGSLGFRLSGFFVGDVFRRFNNRVAPRDN
jgi:hypothetical protein